MIESVKVEDLMSESGVKFGTSGARGLVTQMTDRVCVAYAMAFLQHLAGKHGTSASKRAAIAGDLRPSTPRISQAIAFAAQHLEYEVEFCGWIPSPALALRSLNEQIPGFMVTGSHIPDDRNGIKFSSQDGEITKTDEELIRSRHVELPDVFDAHGMFRTETSALTQTLLSTAAPQALLAYKKHFIKSFPPQCLEGLRLGVYGHSAVGRNLLVELYEEFGAQVTRLGFSDSFIPVDTEAIRAEDVVLAQQWAQKHTLDAIVSTDGDSDRPLLSDENGRWIRGDVAGIVTARFLGATSIATPVSCNTAVEKCGCFKNVVRTRIGSPFVIAAMEKSVKTGATRVAGYEANGGFLTMTDLEVPGGNTLPALPTRDAIIVHLSLLLSAKEKSLSLSQLLKELPQRFTVSDRDQSFAQERSASLFSILEDMNVSSVGVAFAGDEVGSALGPLKGVDMTDGMRFIFSNDDIIHLRPSGNAPELRCYAESSSEARAHGLMQLGLKVARTLVPTENG